MGERVRPADSSSTPPTAHFTLDPSIPDRNTTVLCYTGGAGAGL